MKTAAQMWSWWVRGCLKWYDLTSTSSLNSVVKFVSFPLHAEDGENNIRKNSCGDKTLLKKENS